MLGGANEAVIRMLISIGKPENVPEFIEQVKRKERTLSGFGHRYAAFGDRQNSDPDSPWVRTEFTRLPILGHTLCARLLMKSSKCRPYPTLWEEPTLLIPAL